MIEPTREWEIKGDKCFNKDLEAMVKKTRREKNRSLPQIKAEVDKRAIRALEWTKRATAGRRKGLCAGKKLCYKSTAGLNLHRDRFCTVITTLRKTIPDSNMI